jgi:hypothetical protein
MKEEHLMWTDAGEQTTEIKGGPGSGNFGHEGREGQVGGSAPSGGAQVAASATRKEGGASVSLKGKSPKSGYMVSPYLNDSKIVKASITRENRAKLVEEFKKYRDEKKELLQKPGHYLGAWIDTKTKKLYFDISVNLEDESEARALARKHRQIAYWDVKKHQEVRIED